MKRRDFLKKSSLLGLLTVPSLSFEENKNDISNKRISEEEKAYLILMKFTRTEAAYYWEIER